MALQALMISDVLSNEVKLLELYLHAFSVNKISSSMEYGTATI